MCNRNRFDARARSQRGMSLLFALIALVALSLAAVALVRSVDTGGRVIGNLGFKQDATSASDRATERAIAWLQANPDLLEANAPGYYASSLDSLDPTGRITSAANKKALVNWDLDGCAGVPTDMYLSPCTVTPSGSVTVSNNTSKYLITRLCPAVGGQSAANVCAKPAATSAVKVAGRGGQDYSDPPPPPPPNTAPYYRIVVRTVGGRGSVSFTETIVHF